MPDSYQTILRPGVAEFTEKKSRFISEARPVADEAEARAFLEEIRKKYWDATHNVWAYQLGERHETTRYSDDGEPAGTAGQPVLNVLKGEGLRNVAVVVTRYFGGTLLGAGGLVRAYGRAARECVEAAGIARMTLYHRYRVTLDYPTAGKVEYECGKQGVTILDKAYTDCVAFSLCVEDPGQGPFLDSVQELSGGRAEVEELPDVFGALVDGQLVFAE